MVASAGGVSKTLPREIPKAAEIPKSTPAVSDTAQVPLQMEDPSPKILPEKPVSKPSKDLSKTEAEVDVPPLRPESFTIVEVEDATGLPLRASQEYLVWKDKDGTLGFGNVAYPDADILSICALGKWFHMKRIPEKEAEDRTTRGQGVPDKKDSDALTDVLKERFLAWRDGHGSVGFGDVAYPKPEGISEIYVDGTWQGLAEKSQGGKDG